MIRVILECEGLAHSPGLCRENRKREKRVSRKGDLESEWPGLKWQSTRPL